MNSATPAAEVQIDESLVRSLIQAQYSAFANLDISLIDPGWDNALVRRGTEFAVRLPRRAVEAEIIRHEQKWLPTAANRVSIPVPSPLAVGVTLRDKARANDGRSLSTTREEPAKR